MRIAVFAPVFVRPTETFILDATLGLGEAGHAVHVLTLDRAVSSAPDLAEVREVGMPAGLSLSRLLAAVGRRSPLVRTEYWRVRGLRASLLGMLGDLRPDVILAHYGRGGILLGPVAGRLGVPLVVSFHGADECRLGHRPEWRPRFEALFADAALVTGPSRYILDRLVSLGCPAGKARLLHYGIKTDMIPVRPPVGPDRDRPVRFLFVGRHTPKKDPVGLLRAFRNCLDELGKGAAKLTMIGSGPLSDEVAAAVGELGLDDQVTLAGHLPHEAALRAYAEHDIYVQHSVTAADGEEEGLPVSITEALAAGLPVIATRHSGIPEVVREDETGYLVEEHDVAGMGHRMAALARDDAARNRLGAAGRALIRKGFDFPAVRARLEKLLESAAEPR